MFKEVTWKPSKKAAVRHNQKYALSLRLAGLAAVCAVLAPAHAGENPGDAAVSAWPRQFHSDIARLAEVEWRLREAAGGLCPELAPATGLKFDYRGAYPEEAWPVLEQVLGMGELPQVAAVVPGSPAQRAGIRPGDEIAAVNGKSTLAIAAASEDPDLLADTLEEHIATVPENTQLQFLVRRTGEEIAIALTPVTQCAARFVLKTGDGKDAYSDSSNIAMSTGMIRFMANDDELALIAGHELAHVVNRDGKAKGLGHRRRMEDAADALGAALAHCAGYDVALSLDFWARHRKNDLLRWFRAPSHRSPKSRRDRLAGLAGSLTCPITQSNSVNDAG